MSYTAARLLLQMLMRVWPLVPLLVVVMGEEVMVCHLVQVCLQVVEAVLVAEVVMEVAMTRLVALLVVPCQ